MLPQENLMYQLREQRPLASAGLNGSESRKTCYQYISGHIKTLGFSSLISALSWGTLEVRKERIVSEPGNLVILWIFSNQDSVLHSCVGTVGWEDRSIQSRIQV